jgi:hypothetical protein
MMPASCAAASASATCTPYFRASWLAAVGKLEPQPLPLDCAIKRFPGDVLHHNEGNAVLFGDVMDGDDSLPQTGPLRISPENIRH